MNFSVDPAHITPIEARHFPAPMGWLAWRDGEWAEICGPVDVDPLRAAANLRMLQSAPCGFGKGLQGMGIDIEADRAAEVIEGELEGGDALFIKWLNPDIGDARQARVRFEGVETGVGQQCANMQGSLSGEYQRAVAPGDGGLQHDMAIVSGSDPQVIGVEDCHVESPSDIGGEQ